jgi:hypothetical protein
MPKLTLRDLFAVVTVVAILLAWYVERNRRTSIAGVWYYPTRDISLVGYRETLTIRRDGTFSKKQRPRSGSKTCSGTYAIADDGLVTFHVTSVQYVSGIIGTSPQIIACDASFRCRVAIDSNGDLIVAALDPLPPGSHMMTPENLGVYWECCYTPISHDAQVKGMLDELNGTIR